MRQNAFAARAGGAYSASPDPLAGFGGKEWGRETKGRRRERKGREGKARERRGGQPPRTKILATALLLASRVGAQL